jgi:hypothetical protein
MSEVLGRDHYPDCFSVFLAGAASNLGCLSAKPMNSGFSITKDKVHVHDLQATILHLLGFDHEKLIFRSQGRDFRLTDVHGQVVNQILA